MCFTLWFTGMSGSGKSTLSRLVYEELKRQGKRTELLDGDNIRFVLGKKIGFDHQSRNVHVLYLGLLSYFLNKNNIYSIVAAISPYEDARTRNKNLIRHINPFVEIYCKCGLDALEKRDVKGLYKLAREGKIKNFTGIDDPYEEPTCPDLILDTEHNSVEYCYNQIINYLKERNLV